MPEIIAQKTNPGPNNLPDPGTSSSSGVEPKAQPGGKPETSPRADNQPKAQTSEGKGLAGASPPKVRKRRRLKVAHPERCIGCLSCMFACSRIRTGNASLQDSAIKIQTQGGIEGDFRVVACRDCENAPCVRVCSSGALERKQDGRVVFHKELCDNCGKCEKACLIGAISRGSEGMPIRCIHCGGCVAFCPHGVLKLEEVSA